MVTIRSTNDIVLALIDFYRTSIPDADTKPGTVIRDLFVDGPSSQLALLYDELSKVSNLQSLRLVAGSDLDKLAQNFGATRKQATPSSGVALLTFSSLPAVVGINKGDSITASNGLTFTVINGLSVDPSSSNFYKSVAVKYQNILSFLNITDQFAVEVSVQSSTSGTASNIPQYSLSQTSISGVSNVTNAFSFTGGNNQEDDATFRNRVLSIFSGSNIGTALGYKNLALSNSSVEDALVIGPGNPLMTRDGTQVKENSDGSFTIISEGSGGKVDVVILGNELTGFTDTFIYHDKSNKNDPTDPANDVILGQIPDDVGKTVTQKRIDDITSATLPAQPVQEILEVTGTLSGTNFIPQSIDELGRSTGNYELIKDTGVYAGSPWGFDKFHWTSNQISFQEDRTKGVFNGQDVTTFSDVIIIPEVQQNISITNENSLISSGDRSIIQLLHTPATSVTRVFNVNTGERYIVINQNLDGTGLTNNTGRIQITGNTLPASSDVLQVDYTWIVSYDPYSDYDGKILKNNPRASADSIDWDMSNVIRNERVLFSINSDSTLYTGITSLPISTVITVNSINITEGLISTSVVPNFLDRLTIVLTNLSGPINTIESILLLNSNQELYDTGENNGIIINNRVVVGTQIKYNVTIILPTDTSGTIGDFTNITYNQVDTFNLTNSTGSAINNQITIPIDNINTDSNTIYLDVTYITSVQNLFVEGITSLPISRSGNGFILNNNVGSINSIPSNITKKENQTIQKDGSGNLFIVLSIPAIDFSLLSNKIISVFDLNSKLEIWNAESVGLISINSNGNYQLTFSGYNNPQLGDNVLVIYFANDIDRVQPFTYENKIIKKNFDTLLFDFLNNNFYIPINNLINETNLHFNIFDNTTNLPISTNTDGYIFNIIDNGLSASFASSSTNFSSIDDIFGKTLGISFANNINNDGYFNILGFNSSSNILDISIYSDNLNINQVSVIRLLDGKELWSSACSIDLINNRLILPSTILAFQGDEVMVLLFNFKNLHQSPTKLSVTVADQVNNTGIITSSGTTITEVSDIVFSATSNGLQQNVIEALKLFLNLSSVSSLPNNISIARIVKIEKVSATTNNQVLSVIATYDVNETKIKNNIFYMNEMIYNSSLSNLEFILPLTDNNINNSPIIGDKLRITFYYSTFNDFENLYFTKNGTLYTNKKFVSLEKFYVSSGFNASKSARFTVAYFTQPATGSRYTSFYNYLAPKQNERILINYNYNKLIGDTTFTIESHRPINADVLVRSAKELLIDATVNIVIKSGFIGSTPIVLQNARDRITSTINTEKLGDIINSTDLIVAAQSVDGVERARIIIFNETGKQGQALTIQAQVDQYFVANNINVAQENITV